MTVAREVPATHGEEPPELEASSRSPAGVKRRSLEEFHIATVAAIVALVVALIGGGFSVYAASKSSESSASQARADFVRTQRQAIYGAYISDVRALQDTLADLLRRSKDKPPITDEEIRAVIEAFELARKQVELDAANIELVGSASTAEAVSYVRAVIDAIRSDLAGLADVAEKNTSNIDSQVELTGSDYDYIDADVRNFLAAGRGDLLND